MRKICLFFLFFLALFPILFSEGFKKSGNSLKFVNHRASVYSLNNSDFSQFKADINSDKKCFSTFKSIVYILPHKVCSDYWKEKYGDRIYFYLYEDLSKYEKYIREDFEIISSVYKFVIIVLPANDTSLYFDNLRIIDYLARLTDLKVIFAIFPKEKYGREDTYLDSGTPMHRLILKDMKFLSNLSSTYKIAIWYGWEYRENPSDIVLFYYSLPEELKNYYTVWLDDIYATAVQGAYSLGLPENVLIITELYSKYFVDKYSDLYSNQMVITGYQGAATSEEWKKEIEWILSDCKTPKTGIWIFYDRGDGSNENFTAFIDNKLSDFSLQSARPCIDLAPSKKDLTKR